MFNPVLPVLLIGAVLASGCAQRSAHVTASYVSPLQFQGYSCGQIAREAQRITSRANERAGVQDKKAQGDAVATGVALVLFWPAVFFIKGDKETAAELGRMKGELDALEQMSIQRNCGITFDKRA